MFRPFRYRHIKALETTHIPTRGEFAQCGAMAYLAVLAYPMQDEWTKRDRFIEAAKALLFKWWIKRAEKPKEKSLRRAAIPRDYREHKNEQIDGTFRALQRRIVLRLRAREAVDWFIIQGRRFGPFDGRTLGLPIASLLWYGRAYLNVLP